MFFSNNLKILSSLKVFKFFNIHKFFLKREQHPFHLVEVSPWPFTFSFALFLCVLGFILVVQKFLLGLFVLKLSFVITIFFIFCWFLDIILESTFY